jgi:hypothetical protein
MRLVAGSVIIGAIGVFLVLALTGRPLPVPGWVLSEVEGRINAAVRGELQVELGAVEAVVGRDLVPRVRLSDVRIRSARGAPLAEIDEVRSALFSRALLSGRIEPTSLAIAGARIEVRRRADGTFDLPAAAAATASAEGLPRTPADVAMAIDRVFQRRPIDAIERIEAERVAIRIEDERSGRTLVLDGGTLTLDQSGESVAMGLAFDLRDSTGTAARAEVDFASRKSSPEARVELRVTGVPARDLAAQVPALAWLAVLDAPISGSIRSGIDERGAVRPTAASLSVGAGALDPTGSGRPVPFDSARIDVSYDPAGGRLTFDTIDVRSDDLSVTAEAKARLAGTAAAPAQSMTAQVRITDLRADPQGVFADPVRFAQGAVDVRVTFDPFRIDVGQMVLIDRGRRIDAAGDISADAEGWTFALDFGIDAIASERLLALWPVGIVPKTRKWLAENVATAELFDLKAALRTRPGAEPVLSLDYSFRDADVRFMRTLPPVQRGRGYATIHDNAYTLVLEAGFLTPPEGGEVDVAGSVLRVADIRVAPAMGELRIATQSTITAALSLLDQPPFGFLTKAGRAVDEADGKATISAMLRFPLARGVKPADVSYSVDGILTDVRSERIIPGRSLVAERLTVQATPEGIRIGGAGAIDGVPFDAVWAQLFGAANIGRSTVRGEVELSQRFVDAFGIGLPKGSVGGRGRGNLMLEMERGEPARFSLSSRLEGIDLSIAGLGWSKPARRAGTLSVEGRLGTPTSAPDIESLRIEAPGLTAVGSITLNRDGSLDAARFSDVDVGDWFRGGVTLTGQGRGRPVAITVSGGRADMRRASFGKRGGGGPPMSVALDRLTISSGISLTGFRGEFTAKGGFSGRFSASVNDGAAISGTVVPKGDLSAFRITSDDAGAVFRAADIFTRGRGGAMELVLDPVGGGKYEGFLEVRNIRVVDAPVLAELLGLISVVGLLEQLNGNGILFTDAQGTFRLSNGDVQIHAGSAVGASLGVSAQGVYLGGSKELDLVGVISPIYIVNVVGKPFTKRREGLFGFNYRMSGPSSDPRVTVNPLSLLTPGMFRELFRRPPPTLQE